MLPKDRTPTHPGEMLLEEFLKLLGMTQTELAERIHVSYPRVKRDRERQARNLPRTDLRLSRLLGTIPASWLNGQRNWDFRQ